MQKMDKLKKGMELDAFREIKLMNIRERLSKEEYEKFAQDISNESIDKKFEELFKRGC